MTRRQVVGSALAGAVLLEVPWAGWVPTASAAPPANDFDDADYWNFCDRTQRLVDGFWSESRGSYLGCSGGDTSYNSNLLFAHAAAARMGHHGLVRNDHRARVLAWRLCQSPPWRPPNLATAAADQTHAYGWGAGLETYQGQHVVVDTAVVRGLAEAWYARRELDLPAGTVKLIEERIRTCATSEFYLYPALRLNQINWPVEIYVHAVRITGDPRLVTHDLRQQFDRFVHAMRNPAPGMRIPHLGPGYRFHYLPQYTAGHPVNVDSAEYANIVCGSLRFYDEALRMKMAPLPVSHVRLLRAWAERVMCGYWTHGGYMNWDSGLGFDRWHQGKKHGLCQAALLAIALTPRFRFTEEHSRWAKYFFDRGLEFFEAQCERNGGEPPPIPFGVTATGSAPGDARLWTARMIANAANAARHRLGKMPSELPPPLYAYDPDIGRLAVTTPAYNTAVIVVNQGAFPYGGLELARLYDSDQEVAANIGGVPPAAFGITIRDHTRNRVTHSQRGRRHANLHDPPLRLVHAPWGASAHPPAYPRHPYAGPFSRIDAVGRARCHAYTIRTRHRFKPTYVETRWQLTPRRRGGRCSVQVTFPSWGRDARISAHFRDGRVVEIGDVPIALDDVTGFSVASSHSGYAIAPRSPMTGMVAELLHPQPQKSAPRCGPTLAIRLLDHRRPRYLAFTARIAVVRRDSALKPALRRLAES